MPCTSALFVAGLEDLDNDTYLLVPSTNSTSRLDEIAHIEQWAAENNLKLNRSKLKETTFKTRGVRGKSAQPPPPCLDIERVSSLTLSVL